MSHILSEITDKVCDIPVPLGRHGSEVPYRHQVNPPSTLSGSSNVAQNETFWSQRVHFCPEKPASGPIRCRGMRHSCCWLEAPASVRNYCGQVGQSEATHAFQAEPEQMMISHVSSAPQFTHALP